MRNAPENNPENATEFSAFIERIRSELLDPSTGKWQNDNLPDFLEALSAVFVDHQGKLLPEGDAPTLTYRSLAHMFLAARIYD